MRLPSHFTIFLFLFIGLGALMCTWTEVFRWAYNAEFPRRRKFFLHPTRWPTLLGIAFFDAVITDARESTIGSFAEATLAGPVFMFFPWVVITTYRARGPAGQMMVGCLEVLIWTGINWMVAPSTAIPWYCAWRLSEYGRGAGGVTSQSTDKGKKTNQAKSTATDDAGVSLDRDRTSRWSAMILPLIYGLIVSSALPFTLGVLGKLYAKYAIRSWLPWSYDWSHGLLTTLIHDARVNDMTSMLTFDAIWTMIAITAHSLVSPLTPRTQSNPSSILFVLLAPILFLANLATAGTPWALSLVLMEWGAL